MRRNNSPRKGLGRVAVLGGLAAALVLGGLGGVHLLRGATGCQSQYPSPTWHAVETANFRILSFGHQGVGHSTADACEAMRERLSRRWLPAEPGIAWSPKCELVLHPSDEAYLREVGAGGRNTVGSAVVNRREGRIVERRIDIRATQRAWQTTTLGHELTHVILADRFGQSLLPRWVDEGIAILADSAEKQGRHLADLKRAIAGRGEFRVLELITLSDYPPAGRWGTFYGQSASLVGYLVEHGGEPKFMDFVQAALERGYEAGLRQEYCFGVAELERRWQEQLRAPQNPSERGRRIASGGTIGEIAGIKPISLKLP